MHSIVKSTFLAVVLFVLVQNAAVAQCVIWIKNNTASDVIVYSTEGSVPEFAGIGIRKRESAKLGRYQDNKYCSTKRIEITIERQNALRSRYRATIAASTLRQQIVYSIEPRHFD